ncbi:MAG: hypothetical protein PHD05_06690 [Sphaerochaetaceae bacterium]|nr:hypothetical protein [Sphaerochaetaceae bacterium]
MTSCLYAISFETGVSYYEEELSSNKISIEAGINNDNYDISAQFNSPFFDITSNYQIPFFQFTTHYRNSKKLFNQYDLVILASYSLTKNFLSFYINAGLQFSLLSINEVQKKLFNIMPSYRLTLVFDWEPIEINLFATTNTKFWYSGQAHGIFIGENLKIKFSENLDLKLISQLQFSDFLTENIFTCSYQYGILMIWSSK